MSGICPAQPWLGLVMSPFLGPLKRMMVDIVGHRDASVALAALNARTEVSSRTASGSERSIPYRWHRPQE